MFQSPSKPYPVPFSLAALFALAATTVFLAFTGCKEVPTTPATPSRPASGSRSHAHDHAGHGEAATGSDAIIVTSPPQPKAGEPTELRLMIHRANGSMVKDFDVLHDKKLHFILIREGLDEFAHLHPEVDAAGNASVEHTFPVGGEYHVYVDHQPSGESPATAKATLKVEGESPAAPKLEPNVPGRVSGDGLTADIAIEATGEGEGRSIEFRLSDLEGKPISDLETYLGALGHLVIVSEDGDEYVHAHPQEGRDATDGRVAFEAHFTKPGLYKGWGQFQRAGEVLTIPFVVHVE